MNRFKWIYLALVFSFVRSLSLEAAWTTKRLTNNAGESYFAAIAVDGSHIYVVWCDNTPGNWEIYFRKSVDEGATWQASKRLTYTAGDSMHPDIAVAGADVYLVWYDNTPGNPEIFFRKSVDNGSTWQTAKRLTNTAGNSYGPAIAIYDASIYVTWYDEIPGNGEIYFRKSTDSGANWQSPEQLTNNSGLSSWPDIAAKGVNIYVVWHDDTFENNEIYFMKSANSGSTWQTAKRLTYNTGNSIMPTLAVGGASIYVAWYDSTPGNNEIYSRKSADSGSTWQTAKRLTNNTGNSGNPALTVSGANIFVIWHDGTPGNSEIFFRKSVDSGASWQSPQRLTNNTGTSWWPAIAVNSANIYVTWGDSTPGNDEIFVKYSPF